MKVVTQKSSSLIQGEVESVEMSLSKKGIIAATRMFRDQIYTHKAWAVVREIIANAVDEHLKHGIEKPVFVSLPSMADPNFRVRDYAKGLSKEKVFSVFFQYFESTKSDSNDEIGGFGIGAKSPLAYADMFFVDSYHGGAKTSYVANINGEASTAHKMDLHDSNETGIEVCVPVESSDFTKFAKLAGELIHFSGWNVEFSDIKPIFPNSSYIVDNDLGKVGEIGTAFSSASDIFVNIKGILYACDAQKDEIKNPFWKKVILNMDASQDIEIHPSRERLELSKRNIVKIQNALEKFTSNVVDEIQEKAKKLTTARERFVLQDRSAMFKGSNVKTSCGVSITSLIPQGMDINFDKVTHLEWNISDVTKTPFKNFFCYRMEKLGIKPDGKTKTLLPSYYCRSTHKDGGSILLIGDNVLRVERIVAYAEKHNIPQPVLVIKQSDVPLLWVEGSDFWSYKPESLTEAEIKAVRDRLFPRDSSQSQGVKAPKKLKGDAIMGYKYDYKSSYNTITLDDINKRIATGEKFILIPNELTLEEKSFSLKAYRELGKTSLIVYNSNLQNWVSEKISFETHNINTLKDTCETVCANSLNLEARKAYKISSLVSIARHSKNKDAYFGIDQNLRIKNLCEDFFKDFKPKNSSALEKKFNEAEDRFNKLTSLEKEIAQIVNVLQMSEFKTLQGEAKKIIEKVFC